MPNVTSAALVVVALDWRKGLTGPPAPCVLCTRPALCRSPARNVPCHKGCAETWVATHAADAVTRARLIRAHTPHGGGR